MLDSHTLSAANPERIRYWILNNIHMVWDAIKKLQTIPNQSQVLRITFYTNSYPIVMQWSKIHCPELLQGTQHETNCYVYEDLWIIDRNFSSIDAFADWVKNVRY